MNTKEEEIVMLVGAEMEVDEKEKECECLYEFKWQHNGFDMINKNMCCDVCLEVYERGY